MARVLIIGYGNPLRGDDAVGQLAAERLRERISDPEVEILALHQLTPELMEPISRAARIIFIDAAEGPNPGEIAVREIQAAPISQPFTHVATPEALLAGARALYGAAPPATILTVTAKSFELGAGLSEAAKCGLEKLLQRIAPPPKEV